MPQARNNLYYNCLFFHYITQNNLNKTYKPLLGKGLGEKKEKHRNFTQKHTQACPQEQYIRWQIKDSNKIIEKRFQWNILR